MKSSTEQAGDSLQRPLRDWRSAIISCAIVVCWGVLLGRLIYLQGAQRQLLNTRVSRQSTYTEPVAARPGEILDRNGLVLAMTVTCNSLYAVPRAIEDVDQFVWQISSVLDINADELHRRLTTNPDRHFVWVKRRLTDEESERVRRLQLSDEVWGFRREYLRQYPQGPYAAHVLGIRDIDNLGHGGLEESLDEVIRGIDGVRVMTRDARGIVVEVESALSRSPQHGRTVVTTLDIITQIQTERLLDNLAARWKPHGATAIVMDPHSGEILAMASVPDFDPNHPDRVPDDAWKNLAVSAVFEPGSTFKPFIVGWALQQQKLQPDETISCFNGVYRMGRRLLHDHHPYSMLSVEDVLVKSSNIGMARIAERLGLAELYRATAAFGFGRRTGIELPGEVDGLLRPLDDWDEYSLGSIPMGQELAVTPIQLITAHAALANFGKLVRPRLVLDTEESSLTLLKEIATVESTPQIESRVLDEQIAAWLVRHPMKGVVERGTARSARVQGLSIFGKTGTAQKVDPDTGGYSDTRHVCSFVCGAPAENPQVVVLVVVDEPTADGLHYGGTVAAPMATRLLQFALNRLPRMQHRMTVRPEDDLPIRLR